MMQKHTKYGDWTLKKVLGQGGFGQVQLWTHQSKDPIAIKMCKALLQNKSLKRWESEVEHMRTLDHPNIVKFCQIPEAIKSHFIDGYPAMGMEYCEAGDLRRHLSLPANCCGLPEYKIRDLLGSIGSAVNYLHEKSITHRDLKPENIVLKQVQNKIVFKIIDLGYAKDLNDHSCGNSFVGTYNYLAPEFFREPIRYTATVDYWSLGLVAFECITGRRPFYPESTSLLHFLNDLKKEKRDQHICTEHKPGTVTVQSATFSCNIPQPHALNNLFEARITAWLQCMLRLDPKTRGGSNLNDRSWHDELKVILNEKHIRVYNTLTNTILTMLADDKMRLNTLKKKIFVLTNIPICEQLLLYSNGDKPDCQGKVVETCWKKESEENWMLYLFAYQGEYELKIPSLPARVQDLLTEQRKPLPFKQAKQILCLATNFTKDRINAAIMSLDALKAISYSVNKYRGYFKEHYLYGLSTLFYKFIGKLDLFEDGLITDLKFYEDYERTIYENDEMFEKWLGCKEEVKEWRDSVIAPTESVLRQAQDLMSKPVFVKKLIEDAQVTTQKLIEKRKMSEKKHTEVLITMKKVAESSNDDNVEMQKGLIALVAHLTTVVIVYSKNVTTETNSSIKALVYFHHAMQELTPQIINQHDVLVDLTSKIRTYQHQIHTDLWESILCMKDHWNRMEHEMVNLFSSIPPENSIQDINNLETGMKVFDEIVTDLEGSLSDSAMGDWDFLKEDDIEVEQLNHEFNNVAIVTNPNNDNTSTNQANRLPVENHSSQGDNGDLN